jgi:NAD-dependent SIR2 family protein deacetylase
VEKTQPDTPISRMHLRSSRSFSGTMPIARSAEMAEEQPKARLRRRTTNNAKSPLQRSQQHSRRKLSPPVVTTPPEADEPPSSQTSTASSTRTSLPNLKGKDLFDSIIWSDALTTSIFYTFISSLRQKILNDVKNTTETHKFIKALRDARRLVRNYTQNIDMLESREGLCTELERGTGNRTRFSQKVQREAQQSNSSGSTVVDSGVEVVHLHGSLDRLRCGLCAKSSSWDEEDRHRTTLAGEAPDCPWCIANSAHREGKGRRGLAVGRLRPDIVLYGEEHPLAHLVAPLITHDLSLGPDVLLILGTSLRVHGLKIMVREFAKAVHGKGGKVIFVNQTKPPESIWGDVIDYWVEWDCDAWVEDLKIRRKDIWSPLSVSNDSAGREEKPKVPAKNPAATRPDVTNGAHLTMKIVERLGRLSGRVHDNGIQAPSPQPPPVVPAPPEDSNKRKRSSLPRPNAVRNHKENGAYLTWEIMANLRRLRAEFAALWASTQSKMPLTTISANIPGRQRTRLKSSPETVTDPTQLPTPPNSDQATSPLTPKTQRIKQRSSISAILSSPFGVWRDAEC